jgi:hypothetical protein
MQIIDYTYRKPKFLKSLEISASNIDTIGLHNTGNNNDIKMNTDYHIDTKKWAWLGYSFYIEKGKIYRIRGMEHQDAGIKGHNWHTVNIAIEGNYNKDYISKQDMKALEWLIRYLKEKNPHIKYIKGHNSFSNTSCPGKNIDVELIIANTQKEVINIDSGLIKMQELQQDNEFLIKNNIELIVEVERLDKLIRKDREKYDELKKIYKEKVKELQYLRAKTHL